VTQAVVTEVDFVASRVVRVALAGNPNAGKTSLFNAITGARQHVGNWPGVTVEKKEGRLRRGPVVFAVVDLPGTYSLTAYSIEEVVARDYILGDLPDVVVQVLDAGNLERNLYLTAQLVELGAPLVVALNMADVAEKRGLRIDRRRLAEILGAPVVATVGTTGEGVDELLEKCLAVAEGRAPESRPVVVPLGEEIEEHVAEIAADIRAHRAAGVSLGRSAGEGTRAQASARWRAIKLLEGDRQVAGEAEETAATRGLVARVGAARTHLEKLFGDDVESVLTEKRYGFVAGAIKEVMTRPVEAKVDFSERVDRVLTHRALGMPIFFLLIWAMFQFTFTLGAYPTAAIEWLVARVAGGLAAVLGTGLVKGLVVDGIVQGVGGVLVFLPNIFLLFAFISVLEDSGYMARAAFLMDRVMHLLGLHGKSFIPMLMGFGCNAPAIMATRTLESQRDRILTILINPLVSCSARLPVYILVAGAFFAPKVAGTVIFSIYFLGLFLAILMGRLFSRTILKGEAAPFVLELPPYRLPTPRGTAIHMWARGKVFLRKMGGVILVGSVVIWALGALPLHPTLSRDYDRAIADAPTPDAAREIANARDAERIERSWIGRIGGAINPVFAPLGFSWRESVALVTGFVAKEIVVSTMGVLHQVGAEEGERSEGLRAALRRSGMDPVTAYAFMAFVLIYTPCLGTLAAIRRETNSRNWTIFSVAYSLALAWVVAAAINFGGHLVGLA
jgi:ferrous iron transport protein B